MKINYFKSVKLLFTIASLLMLILITEYSYSKSFPSKKRVKLQYHVFAVSRAGITRDPAMPVTPNKLKWVANSATLIYGFMMLR